MTPKKILLFFLCLLLPLPAYALNLQKLPEADIQMRKQIVSKLEPLIRERDSKRTLAYLSFEELYAPLTKEETDFLKELLKLKRKEVGIIIPWQGISAGKTELVIIKGQKVKEKVYKKKNGKVVSEIVSRTIPPQFLPPTVYKKYLEMMAAMKKDIGKKLYIESGYRSSAYQLYLFIYFLKNHDFSIIETAKFVALPGYSEHGSPEHQAVDFINKDGINGDPNVEEFEALPENKWLMAHAHEYGFVLSYPKTGKKGITYEPWHWRYDPTAAGKVK